MAGHQAGRNVHRRNTRSRRALGSDRREVDLWQVDQPGPGRTGVRAGAGAAGGLWGEGDDSAVTLLEGSGGRTRVGVSEGGRGIGRLRSLYHAAGPAGAGGVGSRTW